MIGNFTRQRRRRFIWQALVWSAGCFLVLPGAIVVVPYLIGRPWSEFGETPMGFLVDSGIIGSSVGLWILGISVLLLTNVFNPIAAEEREEARANPQRPLTGAETVSTAQGVGLIIGAVFYLLVAGGCVREVWEMSALWGIVALVDFAIAGFLALRHHINYVIRHSRTQEKTNGNSHVEQ